MAPLTHDFDEAPSVDGNFWFGLAVALVLSSPIFFAAGWVL